jgi:NAD(P)-dependent dehydrogenase (short-subunit alcohol dehydrogenase family)
MKLEGAVIIVSGGASGLGEATVRHVHCAGASVVIADVADERGRQLAAALGSRARFARTDVTSEPEAQAAVDLAVAEFGRLQILVNCAGISPGERVLGRDRPHQLESFARCVQINLIGSFNMLRLAAAAIAQYEPDAAGERGVIINTASIAAYDGQIGQVAYAAAKAGIVGMTLPAARELARAGIRVMTIAPGLFLTPMLDTMPPEVQESLGRTTVFPARFGRPEEYAALVEHIIENQMLNGETIRLDGAVRLAAK